MKTWIRHVNGTVEDLGDATESEAIEQFRNHDWDAELANYDPDKDSSDHCLPAFGIADGDRASCDLTPIDDQFCKVNLYFHKPTKLFGIIPTKKNVWEHLPMYRRNSVAEVVKLFYAHDVAGLSELIQREKAG